MRNLKLLILTSAAILSLSSCSIAIGGSSSEVTSISENTSETTSNNTTSEGSSSSSSSSSSQSSSSQEEENKVYNISAPNFETRAIATKEEVTFDDFFNLGNTISINIDISDEELQKIEDDRATGYKSEIYHRADKVTISLTNYGNTFTWEFENVGIRQKGNTSRQNIFNDEGHLNLNHYKLSFDETFTDTEAYDSTYISTYGNLAYDTREFLGLSGLDIKWDKNYDGSHIREAYASYLYRASGILSQHIGLTKMTITQTDSSYVNDFGLCSVFEPASKSLIKRALKSGTNYINMPTWSVEKNGIYGVEGAKYGDLYKASYGIGSGANSGAKMTSESISGARVGVGNLSGSYIPAYERKTNTDVDYTDSLIKTAFKVFDTKNYANISNVVDIEYLAIEEAVSYFVSNPDSLRNNYNNYQVYFRRTDGKMVIIPIDNDRCLGITKDFDPFGNGGTNVGFYSNKDCWGNTNNNPLLQATIMSNGTKAREIYTNFAKQLAESSWLTTETFNTYVEKAKASYSDYSFDTENYNLTFDNFITQKLNTFAKSTAGSSEGENVVADPSNLYLVGSYCDWNGVDKFTRVGNSDIYTVTITPTKIESGGCIKIKLNGGGSNYSVNDYSIAESNGSYSLVYSGSSFTLYGLSSGDSITINVNVKTGAVTISKNGSESGVITSSEVSSSTTTSNDAVSSEATSGLVWGDINSLAIMGTHNGWSASASDLFTLKEGNIYSCTITVGKTNDGIIEMKIGTYPSSWSPNNYSINFETGFVVSNNGNSVFPETVNNGDQIYFELNIATAEITYTIL